MAEPDTRLVLYTHWFYAAPWSFHYMPADLAAEFATAPLTLLKGDLNYRRLVGDCDWPPITSFTETVSYFPGSVAALRTLKSDVVTGIEAPMLAALDECGEPLRTNGSHGLIQVREDLGGKNIMRVTDEDSGPCAMVMQNRRCRPRIRTSISSWIGST